MRCIFWIALVSAAILCTQSIAAETAQPDQALPPPPGMAPAQNPGAPSKMAADSAKQAPAQAPTQAPAAPQAVTCTVMVPQLSYKTITVPDVVCQPEQRQQNVTVCRMVPETQMVSCTSTVVVPERRTTQQTFTACRLTVENVARQVTVMVPQMETRQGTRTVCQPVAVQEMQTVCKDAGQWAAQSYVDSCGCKQTCQVWVPNMVTEQVPVTVYKPQFVEEQFEYQVAVCRPQQQTINEQVAKPVYETQTREVSYFVPVAKQVEQQVPRTTFKPVMENRVVNYTVMVPQRVERQVQVPVCTMVPKQVTYTVPSCPGGACGW